jgi:hypothetical protein
VSAKPPLTATQKQNRIDYCINNINLETGFFKDGFDTVHVDEKWFFIKKSTKTYYLTSDEPDPTNIIRNKRYIEKVMFLCAVARPRWNTAANQWFDGKIGLWPFVEMVPAQRTSRNRPAGTPVMKTCAVTSAKYKEFIMEKVIPAIKEKWPVQQNVTVKIQQDNATPHHSFTTGDATYMFNVALEAATGGMSIVPVNQPANSPDLNVLDLGFFNAIQSLQQKKKTDNIEELVAAVQEAFEATHRHTLNKVFLSHQAVMEQVILNDGGNEYKLPHMGKDRLARNSELPVALAVSNVLRAKIATLQGNQLPEPGPVLDMEDAIAPDGDNEVGGPPVAI